MVASLKTLLCCWISVVEKACLWFNPKDSPHNLFIWAQNYYFDIVWADFHEDSSLPCRESGLACSFPGNLSKLLHLGLCTFTTCNIAIKLVADFSTGHHTDRFEATSSLKPFLVFFTHAFIWPHGASFWNVCICGAAFPFCRWQAVSMFPSWCHVENQCRIVNASPN